MQEKVHVHARRTSRHFATFTHAIDFSGPVGFGLAFHVIVIVRLATGADEV